MLLLLLPVAAPAVTMEHMDVTVEDNTVRTTMVTHLQAKAEQVRAALTDFGRLERLASHIRNSEVVERDTTSDHIRVRTEVRQCLGFFCRELTRVEALHIGEHTIRARIIPEASDFREGRTLWLITPDNGGTRLEVQIRLTPKEPIPGLFSSAVEDNMREQLHETLSRLEGIETVPTRAQAGR